MRKVNLIPSTKMGFNVSSKNIPQVKSTIQITSEESKLDLRNRNEFESINDALLKISKANRNSWKLNKIKSRIKGRILNYKKTQDLHSNIEIYSYMSSEDSVNSEELSVEEIFPQKFGNIKETQLLKKTDSPPKSKPSDKKYLRKFLSRKNVKVNDSKSAKKDSGIDAPLGNLVFQYIKSRENDDQEACINDISKYIINKKRLTEKQQFYFLHSNHKLKNIDFSKNLNFSKEELVNADEVRSSGGVNWSTFANMILDKNTQKVSIREIELRISKVATANKKEGAKVKHLGIVNSSTYSKYEKSKMIIKQISNVTCYANKDLIIKVVKKEDSKSSNRDLNMSKIQNTLMSNILKPKKNKSYSLLQKQIMISMGHSTRPSHTTADCKPLHMRHKSNITQNLHCTLDSKDSSKKGEKSASTKFSFNLGQKSPVDSLKVSTLIQTATSKSVSVILNTNPSLDTKVLDSSILYSKSPCKSSAKLKTIDQKSSNLSKKELIQTSELSRKHTRGNSLVVDFESLKQNILIKQNKYLKFLRNFKSTIADKVKNYEFKLVNNFIENPNPLPLSCLKDETLNRLNDHSFLRSLNLNDLDCSNLHNLKYGIKSYEAELKKYSNKLSQNSICSKLLDFENIKREGLQEYKLNATIKYKDEFKSSQALTDDIISRVVNNGC